MNLKGEGEVLEGRGWKKDDTDLNKYVFCLEIFDATSCENVLYSNANPAHISI